MLVDQIMAVIADKCPEIHFNVVDLNENRIQKWNDKNRPFFTNKIEPGLAKIVMIRCI